MQKSAHFPPFLRSLRYRSRYKLETERFSIRPIYFNAYFDARYIFHSTTKISPCPRSIEIFHERVGQIRTREFLESSLLFYRDQNLRERERGGNVKKPCSVKSKLRTSSILKSETKSSRLPTYLENVHLPSRLSPSAFDESRLDFRLGQDFFPVQGSRAAIQGWKNRADGLDGCRFS